MPWIGIWVYPYTVTPVELLVHPFGMDRISAAVIIIITGNRYSMLVDYNGTARLLVTTSCGTPAKLALPLWHLSLDIQDLLG
jgi:hypothetical protein